MTEFGTHAFTDGKVATTAQSKIKWARVSTSGKVHQIRCVVIRWNFFGGTREKPDVTYSTWCGTTPQRHVIFPVTDPRPEERCARCKDHEPA